MHNHTCGCGHHEGDAGCGSREHHHGEACGCGVHHEAPEVEPLASTWSMLSKSAQEQTVPPKREFDFDWEGRRSTYTSGASLKTPLLFCSTALCRRA